MRNKTILDHLAAFHENNIEEILKDYTPHSVIITKNKTYRGSFEIKDFFQIAFLQFPAGDTQIVIDTITQEDSVVFTIWHGETKDLIIPFSTATYIIEHDKILYHTIARITKSSFTCS